MESCRNLERSKADRLQDDMDDSRRRYEQRLSLVMSNPGIHSQGTRTEDVASKVEIQRLKQGADRGSKRPRCTVSTPKSECY